MGRIFLCICIEAEIDAPISKSLLFRYEQNILEKESFATMEKITDSIHLAKEHTKTDAEFYKVITWQSSQVSKL